MHRPRLWWCLDGGLPPLPLHAAGVYIGPEQDNIGNYVVSSYTPNFPALYRILKQTTSTTAQTEPRMLILAHAARGSLPHAHVEVNTIRRVVPPQYMLESLLPEQAPSVEDALAALPHASILHLACHGHQDQVDPLQSGFELANGRLTLAQLMRVRSPRHAQLAYLSACESAAHDRARPEERLNLAATMLLAGFKSVVATMWYGFLFPCPSQF
jgi:CHAT domain-containing protein